MIVTVYVVACCSIRLDSYIQYMNAALLAHSFVSNRDLAQRNATSKTEGLYVYVEEIYKGLL